jgi:hypothetical protein
MDRDLDIANYSIPELTAFFRFPDLEQCSLADIELREVELRELILSSPVIGKGDTSRVIVFLADAKRELLHARNMQLSPPPVVVPAAVPVQAHLQTFTTTPYFIQEDIGGPLPDAHTNISVICVDSLFRDNSNTNSLTGDFVFTLAKPITNVISIKPVSAEVPISWHTISAARNNNEMSIFLFNATYYTPTDSQCTITIPDGTYSRSDFVAAINAALTAFGNGAEYLIMEIDSITNTTIIRTKISTDGSTALPYDSANPHYAPEFYFVLDFTLTNGRVQPLCKNLGWMAGFRAKWYTVKYLLNTNIASVSSEARFDPRPGAYVFIEIDDFTSGAPADVVMSRALDGAYIGRNVLARISIASSVATGKQVAAGSSGDRIFYKRVFSGPVSISKIKVRLLDRFGDVIDLRGSDLSFVLEIETAIGRTRISK